MSRIIFSSDNLPRSLPQRVRARAWAETFMAAGYNGEALITEPDGPFEGHVELMAPAGAMIARSSANNLILNRHPEHIQRDMDDRMMLFFNHGTSQMRTVQLGRDSILKQGEGVLITQENPQSLDGSTCTEAGRVVCLILPHDATADWRTSAQDVANRKSGYDTAAYRLVEGYSRLLVAEAPHLEAAEAAAVIRHIAELTSRWLGIMTEGLGSDAQTSLMARYLAIRNLMRKHHATPTLTANQVAMILGLSGRMVQHVLTVSGTSFSHLLTDIRCRKAHYMLLDPAYAAYGLHTIALLCGFTDYTVFFRAYKRHYAQSPSDTRAVGI